MRFCGDGKKSGVSVTGRKGGGSNLVVAAQRCCALQARFLRPTVNDFSSNDGRHRSALKGPSIKR